jgi:Fe-S-cluster containining protein
MQRPASLTSLKRFAKRLEMADSVPFVYLDQPNKLAFYCLYILFFLNEWVIRSKRVENWLWNLIKLELFYIAGACQHSGHCCKKIMLFNGNKAISNPSEFEALQKKFPAIYQRFYIAQTDKEKILAFDCQSKTQTSCSDYENRPQFCHNYPASAFLSHTRLYDGCGYHIKASKFTPKIRSKNLQKRMESINRK